MKGEKIYTLAMFIHEKMYEYPSKLNNEEKIALYQEYFKLIKKAAYLGYVEALYDMGQQYENINFLSVNNPKYSPKKCIYWYTKACYKNHPDACNNLASFYEEGNGCKKNLKLALDLYKKSAELGSINGKRNYKSILKDFADGGKYSGDFGVRDHQIP